MEGNTHFGGNSQFKTGHHSFLFNEHIATEMLLSIYDNEYLSKPLASFFNTKRKIVSSDFQTPRGARKKTRRSRIFLINFRVFDIALQTVNSSWRKSKQNSSNFMIIKTTLPNLPHGCEFLCFLFMNY